VLVARALTRHDQEALSIPTLSHKGQKPSSGGVGKALDLRQIHSEVHLGSHLVDVLTAGSRRAGHGGELGLRGYPYGLRYLECLGHEAM